MQTDTFETSASSDPPRLIAAARAMLGAGRPAAARPLLAALGRLVPEAPELEELESTLAAAEGRLPEAIGALDHALEKNKGDFRVLVRRAGLFHRVGDLTRALRDAADAVIASPEEAAPKALLGLLLIEKGDAGRARTCLAEALQADPANPTIRLGLAEAAARAGDAELARATLAEGIARAPSRADLRHAAVRVALERGDAESAVALAEQARRDGIIDSPLLRLRARADAELGRRAEAEADLKLALTLSPTDTALRQEAVVAGVISPTDRIPVAALRERYDAVAESFDGAMIAARDRVPGLVRAAMLAHHELTPDTLLGPVLDLGCGTGLVGVAAFDLPLGPWVGVDAAPRMLAIARGRGIYAELIEADLMAYLAGEERLFPLITAADVFIAFGPLDGVFAAVAERLAAGGRFILSLEEMSEAVAPEEPWAVGPTGRYVHSRAGLERAAEGAGLSVQSITTAPLRGERDSLVPGFITVLARAHDAR